MKKYVRRVLSVFLVLALCLGIGPLSKYILHPKAEETNPNHVWFGSYPIEGKDADPTPLKWKVIYDDGEYYTLFNDEVIFSGRYGGSFSAASWGDSEIRQFLNNEFYQKAFSANEQADMSSTTISFWSYTSGAGYSYDSSTDKVYILSTDEYMNPDYGFSESGAPSESRIPYYNEKSAYLNVTTHGNSVDELDRVNHKTWVWTRDVHANNYGAPMPTYVTTDGGIYSGGQTYSTWQLGLQPVIKVKKDSKYLRITDGNDIPLDSENSNELLFDRDVWHFKNFGEPGHEVLDEYVLEPHKMSDEDYKKLVKDIPWLNISKRLNWWANSKLAGSYGHCFGMSLSTILAKMEEFNISEISTARYLRDANLDDQVWGKLCYFQMLQGKDVFQQVAQSGLALFKRDPGTYFNTLYNKSSQVKDGGCPVLLGYGCEGPGGHSVVAFGAEEGNWRFEGETYNKRILIYDNNTASEAYEDDKENNPIWDEDYCLYFNSSTAHWIIPGYKTVRIKQGNKIVSFPGMIYTNETAQFTEMSNDVDVLSPSRWGNKTTPYKATIEITDSNNRKLIDSFTNKEYFISGKLGDLEGKEELDSYYSSSFTEEGEPALRYIILPDETHEYKVTAEDNNCSDFAVSDDSAYLSVEADQASEIQFTLSKEIEIEGCKGEFNVALWKDAATDNEFDTYEITGNGQGEITVSLTDRGVIVEGDNLTEVSVAASDTESGETIRDTKNGPDNANVVEFYRSGDELVVSDPNEGSSEDNEPNNDLDPSVNGIVQCPDGRWAMYKNGKVDTTCTTIAQNKYGWWRVENGYVNFEAQGIYQNKYGWWKTTNGKVTFLEFGLFENENGTWRVENSKVNFKANSIYKGKDGWYKTTNGKVTFDETGVFQNQFGWWYVKNSKVDFDFTGIASNKYGKWYINNGGVDFTRVGFVKVDGKSYLIAFGKVLFG